MTTTGRERRVIPGWAADVGLFVAMCVVMLLAISYPQETDATRSPDLVGYALGLGVAAMVFLRRYWPSGALMASAGVLYLYYALDYPAFSPAVPLAMTTYFAAVAGRTGRAIGVLAFVIGSEVVWRSFAEDSSLLSVISGGTLTDVTLLAAVLLLGEAVRNRRAWAEEVRLRLHRAAEDQEREAAARVQQERLRIARDLHDVMAHTITAINVQAGAAVDVVRDAPEEAEVSLRAIRKEAREAVAELKATVGVLRGEAEAAPRSPTPGLERLDALTKNATASGLRVQITIEGSTRDLPVAVELTAYRIVQESLTNVVRHAAATTATVTLRYEPEALVVEIVDNGLSEPKLPSNPGYGLVGMRERVAALDGDFEAGPTASGGFRVFARLPLGEDA